VKAGNGFEKLPNAATYTGIICFLMQAHMNVISLMEWGSTNGAMVSFMKESGLKETNMGLECGEGRMETPTLGNGEQGKLKVMECIHG
jgi:hypothetical protein